MKRLLFIFVFSLLFSGASGAIHAAEPLYPEKPTGFVNDQAGILGDTTALEDKLDQFESETSNEVAVLTIATTEDVTIEEYAVTLFEKWGIGKADKDNGILLLIAKDDRKLRIETGYGLEGALPDGTAKLIIEREITPYFKSNDYKTGVENGVDAIIAATKYEYTPTGSDYSYDSNSFEGYVGIIIFIVIVFLIILSSIFGKKGKKGRKGKKGNKSDNNWWNSGGSSGSSGGWSSGSSSSFGGFSGGSSGGGGSSGSW